MSRLLLRVGIEAVACLAGVGGISRDSLLRTGDIAVRGIGEMRGALGVAVCGVIAFLTGVGGTAGVGGVEVFTAAGVGCAAVEMAGHYQICTLWAHQT